MRALVQRVSEASVTAAIGPGRVRETTGSIGPGLVALIGVTHDDDQRGAARLAQKLWRLRVFDDDDGAMNLSCADLDAELLVVSQFTLYADTRKGRRPSFVAAAAAPAAEPLVDALVDALRDHGASVATGRFRHHMQVSLVNDGPVTLMLEV